MVEALAVLFVVAVALGAYLSAWVGANNLSNRNLPLELKELIEHREMLRQKTLRGQAEQWDSVMMGQLAYRLNEVERQIASRSNLVSVR